MMMWLFGKNPHHCHSLPTDVFWYLVELLRRRYVCSLLIGMHRVLKSLIPLVRSGGIRKNIGCLKCLRAPLLLGHVPPPSIFLSCASPHLILKYMSLVRYFVWVELMILFWSCAPPQNLHSDAASALTCCIPANGGH